MRAFCHSTFLRILLAELRQRTHVGIAVLLLAAGSGVMTNTALAEEHSDMPIAEKVEGCERWLGDWAKESNGPTIFRIEGFGGAYTIRARASGGQWSEKSEPMDSHSANGASKEMGLTGCLLEDKNVGLFLHGLEPKEPGIQMIDYLWSGGFFSWKTDEIFRIESKAKLP